ncbi:FecR family protein [Balneola sp. MJW-20]|uniref:FecR family protein n=1 Tax=Gracilimonas aurantiaca TaxID=3234185 RepID=UPI0034672759
MSTDKNLNDSLNPFLRGHSDIKSQSDWRESSPDEIESALNKVWDKIEEKENFGNENSPKYSSRMVYSIAAAVLLTVGFGYLIYPSTITVPNGSSKSVVLADGTEIDLSGGSSVTYNRLFGYLNRDIELNGRAYFSVEKDDTPFVITTAHTRTTVVGTEFSLEDWNTPRFKEAMINVTEGQVLFNSLPSNEQISLIAGESSKLNNRYEAEKVTFKEDALSWREGHHFFDNMTIHDVLSTLEREFGKNIDHPSGHEFEGRITAFYRAERSLESIINDICTLRGYTFYTTNNGYRIIPG